MSGSIVDVPGYRVGHYTDLQAGTGCTVLLCDRPTTAGCTVSGGSPGTRETALLDPNCLVEEIHAVLLSGGSAFGLDAAGGVMRYLEATGKGFDTGIVRVPIVPAAILFDLGLGDPAVRPGPEEGYKACLAAAGSLGGPWGNVGAGTGATVGKAAGPRYSMKGGLGSASVHLPGGATVGAAAAVNCAGDVVDPGSGTIIAGARRPDGGGFLDTEKWLLRGPSPRTREGVNTTLVVVATDAYVTKAQASRLALLAHQGLARAIRPITPFDGDTVFALGASRPGDTREELTVLGVAAAEAVAAAIVNAVTSAQSLLGCPAARDLGPNEV